MPIRLAALLFTLLLPLFAQAHFQLLIPSLDIVNAQTERQIDLDLRFSHPMMQGPLMNMATPLQFGVLSSSGREDLSASLQPKTVGSTTAFQARYRFRRPGDYIFYLEPAPYWEASEAKMIIHYTKVVVDAFAYQDGWDAEVGFPVEIEPLVRPYGLWSGNLFRGLVRHNGQPVPFAVIEVEWRNDGSLTPPSDPYITQVIKADINGVFSYAMPRAGWWGFAALIDGEPMPNPEGQTAPVELGGLIWVFTRDMQ